MLMLHSQFMRIETRAGGVSCTDREFIKAAHHLLSPEGRSRRQRALRHSWLRDGLELLNQSRNMI